MTIEEKNKKAREYGYSSEEERLLYKDVCTDNYPIDLQAINDYCFGEETYHTKKESLEYISKHNLFSLLDKVKDESEFNRLVEIYLYAINYLSVIVNMEKYFMLEAKEAFDVFDGEKQQENIKSYLDLSSKKEVCYIMMIYIEGAIRERVPEMLIEFEDTTTPIKKELLSSKDSEPHF